MLANVLILALAVQSAPQPGQPDDIKDSLARAEALYYEARFNDSIQLLVRANDTLQAKNGNVRDKISVKLQMALAHIGLNNTAAAKSLLVDIYALDSDYALDKQQFSPKVLTLAADARADQAKARCAAVGAEARRNLETGNTAGILSMFRPAKPKCAELNGMEPAAAEVFYKTGLAEYKRGDYSEASRSLQAALHFSPTHEMATQYLELSQTKLQMAEEKILMQWQKEFGARQFGQAAANYRQMAAMRDVDAATDRANTEYRKELTALVDSWNRTCPTADWPKLDEIRNQVTELIPEPAFGEDIRKQMVPCVKPEPKPEPPPAPKVEIAQAVAPPAPVETKPAPKEGCLQMEFGVAASRLKQRVEPVLLPGARAFLQNSRANLIIKVRIDETGTVRVTDIQGGNAAVTAPVKTAVERWKFSPAVDASGARCVETDIPMNIGL